ncbi:MAG: hypothetical protein KGL16_08760 [Acidobacteriota bacterium]|nr:hypothetical protein [Acidobacteriota bacterium]
MRVHRAVAGVSAPALLLALLLAASAAAHRTDQASPRRGQSLQEAWVVGADSVWAWTEDGTGPVTGGGAQGVELSADGGRRWSDATPPGLGVQGGRRWISGLFALNGAVAWLSYGGLADSSAQTILRTIDAGRRWTPIGRMPHGRWCTLQFISPQVGWCAFVGAAAGSATVTLYRTNDGGRRWRVVSRTPIGVNHRPGALPYGGDKEIEFSTAVSGWAVFEAPVGTAPLYETVDGGRTWVARQVSPAPETRFGGSFVGRPVLDGRYGAVAYSAGLAAGSRTLVYASSDGGRRWHPVIPPGAAEPWFVDTITARRWRLLYGSRILATDNAGRTWRTIVTNKRFATLAYAYNAPAPAVRFTTSAIGWVVQQDPTTNVSTLWRTVDGGRRWAQVSVPGS